MKLTFDVAQLLMLGGLIWGLAKMSAAVTDLEKVTLRLADGLDRITVAFNNLLTRVSILEDRGNRA